MAEEDSLGSFDFNKVTGAGKFLKFVAGKPVTIRILTKDPVVTQQVFEGDDEVNLSTKFNFIVWNFTDECAQILSAGPGITKTFQKVAKDEDFGANLQKCDIKISPEGEKLKRVYDVNVLRHSGNEKPITSEMLVELKKIDLDKDVKDSRGRLSQWEPPVKDAEAVEATEEPLPEAPADAGADTRELGGVPIDISDIPF